MTNTKQLIANSEAATSKDVEGPTQGYFMQTNRSATVLPHNKMNKENQHKKILNQPIVPSIQVGSNLTQPSYNHVWFGHVQTQGKNTKLEFFLTQVLRSPLSLAN